VAAIKALKQYRSSQAWIPSLAQRPGVEVTKKNGIWLCNVAIRDYNVGHVRVVFSPLIARVRRRQAEHATGGFITSDQANQLFEVSILQLIVHASRKVGGSNLDSYKSCNAGKA